MRGVALLIYVAAAGAGGFFILRWLVFLLIKALTSDKVPERPRDIHAGLLLITAGVVVLAGAFYCWLAFAGFDFVGRVL